MGWRLGDNVGNEEDNVNTGLIFRMFQGPVLAPLTPSPAKNKVSLSQAASSGGVERNPTLDYEAIMRDHGFTVVDIPGSRNQHLSLILGNLEGSGGGGPTPPTIHDCVPSGPSGILVQASYNETNSPADIWFPPTGPYTFYPTDTLGGATIDINISGFKFEITAVSSQYSNDPTLSQCARSSVLFTATFQEFPQSISTEFLVNGSEQPAPMHLDPWTGGTDCCQLQISEGAGNIIAGFFSAMHVVPPADGGPVLDDSTITMIGSFAIFAGGSGFGG